MGRVCLVLEGGAMRGNFTAGVLDYFLEYQLPVADRVVGVSAGALCGANYCSRQIGRTVRLNCTYAKDSRYLSMNSFVRTGDAMGVDFMYNKIQNELDPFDYEMYANRPMEFYVVCTNVETGKAEYCEIKNLPDDIDLLRASASVPFVSKIVETHGFQFLDGGMADSVPVKWALDEGFDKVITVLTQDRSYVKTHDKAIPLAARIYQNHPLLVEAMDTRYKRYNDQRRKIFELEEKGRIVVLAPKRPVQIKQMEKEPARIMELYNEGRTVARENFQKLQDYLSS
ncbi:MAG: patatin family protein [Actinobacteria bacterium]|nr:patatin family protein [Actinomycetota bacterium]